MKKTKIEAWQKKKIYAIANALKYTNPQDKENDILHMLIWQRAKKDSVRDLTYQEANDIIAYLDQQQGNTATDQVTKGQQKKIWALMYELKALDAIPNDTPIGERLAGIIRRQCKVRSTPQRLFTYLDQDSANKLIEIMKHYVESAEMNHTDSWWVS